MQDGNKDINLNPKQKRFCLEYLIDMNSTQAAIRAGYAEKTAKQIGSRLLTKVDIKNFIQQEMDKKNDELIAKQDEVLKYLTNVMRRNEKDVVVVTLTKEESTYVPDAEGKMRKQTKKEDVPQIVEIPSLVRDANKAAELLGKRYGIFTDKVDVTGALPVIISGEEELED